MIGLISILFFIASNKIEVHTSPPFEISSGYSESWTAGIRNGGSGIDYYFKTIIRSGETIHFDSLWTANNGMALTAVKGNVYDPKAVFSKNDTIILRATLIIKGKVLPVKPPKAYAGAALISYSIHSKKQYYTVRQMEQKKAQPRP